MTDEEKIKELNSYLIARYYKFFMKMPSNYEPKGEQEYSENETDEETGRVGSGSN